MSSRGLSPGPIGACDLLRRGLDAGTKSRHDTEVDGIGLTAVAHRPLSLFVIRVHLTMTEAEREQLKEKIKDAIRVAIQERAEELGVSEQECISALAKRFAR